MGRDRKKHGIACEGPWLPVPIEFLRSRACAELSPHAAKLLLTVWVALGPNAGRNGDISLAPKAMAVRGWNSRATLHAAVCELESAGLLCKTRKGTRLDCTLWACTLYPLDCDLRKLEVTPSAYTQNDWKGSEREHLQPPTEASPAVWRRARLKIDEQARKAMNDATKRGQKKNSDDPLRNEIQNFVPPRNKPALAQGP